MLCGPQSQTSCLRVSGGHLQSRLRIAGVNRQQSLIAVPANNARRMTTTGKSPASSLVPSKIQIQQSGSLTIVVVQPSAQPLAALDGPRPSDVRLFLYDQLVAHSLVVALVMILHHEVVDGLPQWAFPEPDQPLEAGTLRWL